MSTREAGPGLDAEIARSLFGHEVEISPVTGAPMIRFAPVREPTWPHQGLGRMPSYSSEIEAAWLVVERMRELDHSVEITDDEVVPHQSGWGVTFRGPDSEGWYDAPTPALGICGAALDALEAMAEGEEG